MASLSVRWADMKRGPQRIRAIFLSASPLRVLGEAAVVALVLAALAVVLDRTTTYGPILAHNYVLVALSGPPLALWSALRLRRGTHGRVVALLRDVFMSALLGLLPLALMALTYRQLEGLPVALQPAGLIRPSAIGNDQRYALGLALAAAGFIGEFFILRMVVDLVLWWNGVRRRHLQWALTNALLMLVVLVVGLLALALAVFVIYSNPAGALRSLIPGSIVLGVLLAFGIAIVLPPAAVFSYFFARHTTRRLRTLAVATSVLRSGDYGVRVSVEGEDEVARLQTNFNAMAAEMARAVRELEAERDRVQQLLRARRELVASVSHELRTPVATLRGYLESVTEHWPSASPETPPPPTLHRDLQVMEQETLRLQTLIQDLFTLSRAEVSQLELHCAPTDAGAVARHVAETVAPLAWRDGRVEVIAEVSHNLPVAQIDATRLEQVLRNLAHNGVRHTPPGGIVILAARQAEDGTPEIQVRDTGEGIDPAELPHIFERFYRTEPSRKTPESGTGLGLALVKELTEAMGGHVEVVSAPGAGACFTLRLPAAATTV